VRDGWNSEDRRPKARTKAETGDLKPEFPQKETKTKKRALVAASWRLGVERHADS